MQYQSVYFEQPLISITENNRISGLVAAGRYRGFDTLIPKPSNSVLHFAIGHGPDSVTRYTQNLVAIPNMGIFVTPQGTVIGDDAETPALNISSNLTANPRWDAIVATHQHEQISGGVAALYSVVPGTPAPSPSLPTINQANQVILGYLIVPAGTTTISQTIYVPSPKRGLGGDIYARLQFPNRFEQLLSEAQGPNITSVVNNRVDTTLLGNVIVVDTATPIRFLMEKPIGTRITLIRSQNSTGFVNPPANVGYLTVNRTPNPTEFSQGWRGIRYFADYTGINTGMELPVGPVEMPFSAVTLVMANTGASGNVWVVMNNDYEIFRQHRLLEQAVTQLITDVANIQNTLNALVGNVGNINTLNASNRIAIFQQRGDITNIGWGAAPSWVNSIQFTTPNDGITRHYKIDLTIALAVDNPGAFQAGDIRARLTINNMPDPTTVVSARQQAESVSYFERVMVVMSVLLPNIAPNTIIALQLSAEGNIAPANPSTGSRNYSFVAMGYRALNTLL
jgi:hypothetical protein